MSRWLAYFKERFPFPVYVLLCAGYVVSGFALAFRDFNDGQKIRNFVKVPYLMNAAVAFGAIFLFFFLLRMMDEFKDFKKDQVAHPTRPLPRGLFEPIEFQQMIDRLWLGGLLLGSPLVLALAGTPAALFYLLFWFYLWAMYKEFYIGARLQNFPLLYACSHQIILLPISCFAIACFGNEEGYSFSAVLYGVAVLGSFFSYEVGRKLDPKAPLILKTYLTVYGRSLTFFMVVALQGLAATAAYHLEVAPWIYVIEGLAAASALLILFKPEKFKVVEAMVSVSLVAHIWIGLATGDL